MTVQEAIDQLKKMPLYAPLVVITACSSDFALDKCEVTGFSVQSAEYSDTDGAVEVVLVEPEQEW